MPPRYRKEIGWWCTDASVKLPSGKTQRIREKSPINTKLACAQHEQALIKQALLDAASGRSAPAPRFAEFANKDYLGKYVPANNAQGTADMAERHCRLHLVPFFGKLTLDQITSEKIDAYKAEKLATLEASTVIVHLAVLRRILSLAVEWGRLAQAPKFKNPKKGPDDFDFYTADESALLLVAARNAEHEHDRRWRLALLVGLRTGARRGELRGLQFHDFDHRRLQVQIRRQVTGGRVEPPKGGKSRTLPVPRDVCESVAQLQRERGASGPDWVFPGPKAVVISETSLAEALERIATLAGLRPLHTHGLRHSYASQLVMLGTPLPVVQQLLGHSSIRQTMIYAHLSPGAADAAVTRLGEDAARAAEAAHVTYTSRSQTERAKKKASKPRTRQRKREPKTS